MAAAISTSLSEVSKECWIQFIMVADGGVWFLPWDSAIDLMDSALTGLLYLNDCVVTDLQSFPRMRYSEL